MSDQPADPKPSLTVDDVLTIARDLTCGKSFAEVASLRHWSEPDLAQSFGVAVQSYLESTFTQVTGEPEGSVIFVSVPDADQAVVEDLQAWLDATAPEGTEVLVGNMAAEFHRIGPVPDGAVLVATIPDLDFDLVNEFGEHLADMLPEGTGALTANVNIEFSVISRTPEDAVLVVTAEDCNADDLDTLQAHLEDALPSQAMVVANFHFDAEALSLEELVAVRNRLNETIKEMGQADEDGGYTHILSSFRDLAARYHAAMWMLGPKEAPPRDPDARYEVELRERDDAWRLRFMDGEEPVGSPWEADTLVNLLEHVRSSVEATEKFAAGFSPES